MKYLIKVLIIAFMVSALPVYAGNPSVSNVSNLVPQSAPTKLVNISTGFVGNGYPPPANRATTVKVVPISKTVLGKIGNALNPATKFALLGTAVAAAATWAIDELTGQITYSPTSPTNYCTNNANTQICATTPEELMQAAIDDLLSKGFTAPFNSWVSTGACWGGDASCIYTQSVNIIESSNGSILVSPIPQISSGSPTDDELGDFIIDSMQNGQLSSGQVRNNMFYDGSELHPFMQAEIQSIPDLYTQADAQMQYEYPEAVYGEVINPNNPNPQDVTDPNADSQSSDVNVNIDLSTVESLLTQVRNELQDEHDADYQAPAALSSVPSFEVDITQQEAGDAIDAVLYPDGVPDTATQVSAIEGAVAGLLGNPSGGNCTLSASLPQYGSNFDVSFCEHEDKFVTLGYMIYVAALILTYISISRAR